MTDPERNQLLDGASSSSAFGAQAMHFSTVSELSPNTRANWTVTCSPQFLQTGILHVSRRA